MGKVGLRIGFIFDQKPAFPIDAARHQVCTFSSAAFSGSWPSSKEEAVARFPLLSSIQAGSRQGSCRKPDTLMGQSP